MKYILNLPAVIFAFLLTLIPNAFSQAETSTGIANNQALAQHDPAVLRMASFILLHEAEAQLTDYFQNNNKNALNELLATWGHEESLEIKKDFAAITDKPTFKVVGPSLYITVQNQTVEWTVVDPLLGIYKLNGHIVKVNSDSKYQNLRDRFDELLPKESNHSPIYKLLVPTANAWLPALGVAVAVAVRVARPAAAVIGGLFKKKAPAEVAKLAGKYKTMAQPKKVDTLLTRGIKRTGVLASEGTLFSCFAFGTDFKTGEQYCIKFFAKTTGKVLCATGITKKGCVSSASDLVGEHTAIEPQNGGLCSPTEDGYEKDVNIKIYDPEQIKKLAESKTSARLPEPKATIHLHLEFAKEESPIDKKSKSAKSDEDEDEEPLEPKTITQILKSDKGEVVGKNVWTFKKDRWYIDTYDILDEKDPKAQYIDGAKPPERLTCYRKKPSEQCESLYKRIVENIGDHGKCTPEKSTLAPSPGVQQQRPNGITR